MKQLEFPFWAEFERCQLRRNIFAALARVFGEVQLTETCRCQCGRRVRCVVNPAGLAIVWCDECGWYADEKWLLSGLMNEMTHEEHTMQYD